MCPYGIWQVGLTIFLKFGAASALAALLNGYLVKSIGRAAIQTGTLVIEIPLLVWASAVINIFQCTRENKFSMYHSKTWQVSCSNKMWLQVTSMIHYYCSHKVWIRNCLFLLAFIFKWLWCGHHVSTFYCNLIYPGRSYCKIVITGNVRYCNNNAITCTIVAAYVAVSNGHPNKEYIIPTVKPLMWGASNPIA